MKKDHIVFPRIYLKMDKRDAAIVHDKSLADANPNEFSEYSTFKNLTITDSSGLGIPAEDIRFHVATWNTEEEDKALVEIVFSVISYTAGILSRGISGNMVTIEAYHPHALAVRLFEEMKDRGGTMCLHPKAAAKLVALDIWCEPYSETAVELDGLGKVAIYTEPVCVDELANKLKSVFGERVELPDME